jgi:hypothetical protein
MIKMLGFLPRRAEFTRPAFREYYETRHTPLALGRIHVFRKYVRNHLAVDPPAPLPFDTASEFWYDDRAALATVAEWLSSPAGRVLRDDEERFMDRSRIASCFVDELTLSGPPRGFEPGPLRKHAWLLTGDEVAREAIVEACETFVARNAAQIARSTLDLPVSPLPPHLPLRAMLWLWPAGTAASIDAVLAAPARLSATPLTLDAIETNPVRLRG